MSYLHLILSKELWLQIYLVPLNEVYLFSLKINQNRSLSIIFTKKIFSELNNIEARRKILLFCFPIWINEGVVCDRVGFYSSWCHVRKQILHFVKGINLEARLYEDWVCEDIRMTIRSVLHFFEEVECFVQMATSAVSRQKSSVGFNVHGTTFINHGLE